MSAAIDTLAKLHAEAGVEPLPELQRALDAARADLDAIDALPYVPDAKRERVAARRDALAFEIETLAPQILERDRELRDLGQQLVRVRNAAQGIDYDRRARTESEERQALHTELRRQNALSIAKAEAELLATSNSLDELRDAVADAVLSNDPTRVRVVGAVAVARARALAGNQPQSAAGRCAVELQHDVRTMLAAHPTFLQQVRTLEAQRAERQRRLERSIDLTIKAHGFERKTRLEVERDRIVAERAAREAQAALVESR